MVGSKNIGKRLKVITINTVRSYCNSQVKDDSDCNGAKSTGSGDLQEVTSVGLGVA